MPSKDIQIQMHTPIYSLHRFLEKIKIIYNVVDFHFSLTWMISSGVWDACFWDSSIPISVVVKVRVFTLGTQSVPSVAPTFRQYWSHWL